MLQVFIDIVTICARKGIKYAVLSPGSRNALLTVAFARHPEIQCYTMTDERSAAFMALGMAQQQNHPVVLVCTSGTAGLNYSPAVAEAFYQHIPLIIFTADRPPEWIDQLDGQTIRQQNLYGNHVKASYTLPVDLSHQDALWHAFRVISDAIITCTIYPKGPVHINVPFREPFYPKADELVELSHEVKWIDVEDSHPTLSELQWQSLLTYIEQSKHILILGGQERRDPHLIESLSLLSTYPSVTIMGEIISNLNSIPHVIKHMDLILYNSDNTWQKQLQPDLLIGFGQSVISKYVKRFLRKYQAKDHWHIQVAGDVADTFQSLKRIIRVNPAYFFSELSKRWCHPEGHQHIKTQLWYEAEGKALPYIHRFFSNTDVFSEFLAVYLILKHLPQKSILHLANSMAVRYANWIGLDENSIEIFANRGTSGIDGTLSTAVGHAFCTSAIVTLIIGDMSFFYDRNALWQPSLPKNLRIIVLNNHGGGIFKMIDGSAQLPELNTYFITSQPFSAWHTAKEATIAYDCCKDQAALYSLLPEFFLNDGRVKLLEIQTHINQNTEVFHDVINFTSR
ncbi:MAG: 2-succinyl-5-enolpyruvyl-6-hydroxy-3-cyclohexene-1-carboxylic-acid synthase [Desulfobacterales bacterium]|nr:2-succinyl-5-enolpyruvyl-6-hydroxy-3-cyclohexene-1-carboxylic-acid synthase [Desulfobacterales bacterium]